MTALRDAYLRLVYLETKEDRRLARTIVAVLVYVAFVTTLRAI